MKRLIKFYGASPLHLLAVLASLALAAYVVPMLVETNTIRVAIWFVAAAVLHDLLLVPLYALADRSITEVWRRSSPTTDRGVVPWLNYVRFPLAISAVLLLVYLPGITRRDTKLEAYSTLSTGPYLSRWLLVTGIVCLISAVMYALRWRRATRTASIATAPEPRGCEAERGHRRRTQPTERNLTHDDH